MTKTKSTRVSIPKHHLVYLESIASQMGCSELNEAINFLFWELRRANYQFGGTLPQYPTPNAQQLQPQQQFDPSTYEQATAMSGLSFQPQSPQAIQEFEDLQEIDPIIERLAGLVDSF